MPSSSSLLATTLRQQKQVLRKKIRSQMSLLTDTAVQEQSLLVWQRVLQLPEYQNAKSVALFLSMPHHEIATDFMLRQALNARKTLFVPKVGSNFEQADMDMIPVIHSAIDAEKSDETSDHDCGGMFYDDWPKNKWNIPEPPDSQSVAQPGNIDLVIVPGLGFDRKGHRLGQGKGYYDRFIARMNQNGIVPTLIGVGLQPQLVETADGGVPVADYDAIMDVVVTPNETIRIHT